MGAVANTVVSALYGTPVKIFRLARLTNMQESFLCEWVGPS